MKNIPYLTIKKIILFLHQNYSMRVWADILHSRQHLSKPTKQLEYKFKNDYLIYYDTCHEVTNSLTTYSFNNKLITRIWNQKFEIKLQDGEYKLINGLFDDITEIYFLIEFFEK